MQGAGPRHSPQASKSTLPTQRQHLLHQGAERHGSVPESVGAGGGDGHVHKCLSHQAGCDEC